MPVPPENGRPAVATAVANASAVAALLISVQPTDCTDESEKYTSVTAIAPMVPPRIAFCTAALLKAAT